MRAPVQNSLLAFGLLMALLFAGCLQDPGTGDTQETAPQPGPMAHGLQAAGYEVVVHAPGFLGYEPTIGVGPTGSIFVAGAGQALDLSGYEAVRASSVLRSVNGVDWTVVNDFPATFDPVLHVDLRSGYVYRAHQLSSSCATLAFSDDDGSTWQEHPGACGDVGVDFLKLASGIPGPDANALATGVEQVVYLCHNRNSDSARSVCAASFDHGRTWPQDRVIALRDRDGCGGVTSFPVVGPDGTIVVPLGAGCDAVHLATSNDSGDTWSVTKLGYKGAGSVTPRAAFDADGRLYVLSRDWSQRLQLSIQDAPDGPWVDHDVTPDGVRSLGFVAMDVAPDGRVFYAFMGAETTNVSASQAEPGTEWMLYAGVWSPGGFAAEAVELMHVGRVCFGGDGNCPRNLGDFMDGAMGPDGRFWVSFVDGCDDCGQSQSTGTALKILEVRPIRAPATA